MTNTATGILQATNGGILQLSSGTFTNNGILQEIGTSQLQLVNNINVVGGTLATVGSQIHSIFSTLTNVTNNGGLILSDGGQTTLSGTLTNNGTITFASIGDPTSLFLDGNVTLAGSGTNPRQHRPRSHRLAPIRRHPHYRCQPNDSGRRQPRGWPDQHRQQRHDYRQWLDSVATHRWRRRHLHQQRSSARNRHQPTPAGQQY